MVDRTTLLIRVAIVLVLVIAGIGAIVLILQYRVSAPSRRRSIVPGAAVRIQSIATGGHIVQGSVISPLVRLRTGQTPTAINSTVATLSTTASLRDQVWIVVRPQGAAAESEGLILQHEASRGYLVSTPGVVEGQLPTPVRLLVIIPETTAIAANPYAQLTAPETRWRVSTTPDSGAFNIYNIQSLVRLSDGQPYVIPAVLANNQVLQLYGGSTPQARDPVLPSYSIEVL